MPEVQEFEVNVQPGLNNTALVTVKGPSLHAVKSAAAKKAAENALAAQFANYGFSGHGDFYFIGADGKTVHVSDNDLVHGAGVGMACCQEYRFQGRI